ncbi:XRE family plasmid maintenance system antidote protein [Bosea psychrotolerans]|uniref:XRE family plasmid maintenance system antidote protein n=1 Tax=Bosea psychrotolerans TaxID=1871628 RepID=A0A2S4MF67_9HYPH|nr:XRE family plasmid maintenance system antidote protein [Bosea psychrotolerans]
MTSKSSTITEPLATLSPPLLSTGKEEILLAPIPPGEVLLEEFMRPLGVSQNRLARDIDAPVSRIAGIVKGERAITADTALRLAQFFGTSPEMWMALQSDYDLRVARQASGRMIEKRVRPLAA